MTHRDVFPFTAIVGQERLKLALILNAVNPAVGGVLIRGEKGTAKSTSVRALARLLPEMEVYEGCSFVCDPADEDRCDDCRNPDSDRRTVSQRTRVVTLPLNATEDRVAGGIDFNQAVKQGHRVLQPGLLARAHRGILYVDEVNLLDDHIVDIILDAAASGMNVIEREGLSFSHASRFILVGTMNPEEGDLRPQLRDRFGLCVDVMSETDHDRRILTMERREAFDKDKTGFIALYDQDNADIARQILQARKLLMGVGITERLRRLCAEICLDENVAGHRADLVLEQAARALAAWKRRSEVFEEDIRDVAEMVLSHRKREAAPPPPPPPLEEHDHDDNHDHDQEENEENQEDDSETPEEEDMQPPPEQAEQDATEDMTPPDEDDEAKDPPEEQPEKNREEVMEQIFDVGETFKVKKIATPKDRIFRRGSGRRSRTRISRKQGRYVKSALNRNTGDVALDATLRAAAPYQLSRDNKSGLAVVLNTDDIREKIREKRIGNFLLFVVDASGSMGARGRMTASKGAIMSLLLDAYQKRDRVAMVSFRKDEAVVNLPPTSSIERAADLLKEMPVGGRTPLSAGLAKAYEVLRNHLIREPTARPIVMFVTDGKSNVALGKQKPLDEVADLAERFSADGRVRTIVVDTEGSGLIAFGLARKLAGSLNAEYVKTEDLKADTLVNIVKETAKAS